MMSKDTYFLLYADGFEGMAGTYRTYAGLETVSEPYMDANWTWGPYKRI